VPRRPSYSAIVAHLALAVALSGGAVAAVTITGANIKNGTITAADVKAGSLTGADLKKNSVSLDRLSKSLPLQYYSRAQSNGRFLLKSAPALDSAKLGGLPAAAYAKGTVTTTANRVDVAVGTGGGTPILDVPGFARVQVQNCAAAGAQTYVLNTASGSLAWTEDTVDPEGLTGGTAWAQYSTKLATTSWMTLHLSRGAGAATQLVDIEIHDVLDAGTCSYVVQATVYG
jgi:hypothetical protein